MIVGQDALLKKVDGTTLDTFPRSLILLGPKGCGKHMLSEYVGKHLSLPVQDITSLLDKETIDEIYARPEPYVYTITASDISIKQQNIILKFLEEPLKNSYIIILAINKQALLNTILNRCQIWSFVPYSREVLLGFSKEGLPDSIIYVANTPGKISGVFPEDFRKLQDLVDKFIASIDKATVGNTLTIADKIAFKDEADKFNFDLFTDLLLYELRVRLLNAQDPLLARRYEITRQLSNLRYTAKISKRSLFENFLLAYKLGEDLL